MNPLGQNKKYVWFLLPDRPSLLGRQKADPKDFIFILSVECENEQFSNPSDGLYEVFYRTVGIFYVGTKIYEPFQQSFCSFLSVLQMRDKRNSTKKKKK